jgi:hypothetical protein
VLDNPTSDGFWGNVRQDYDAHAVVVEAKNYKGPIKGPQLDGLRKYLDAKSFGRLGILVSRYGLTKGGQREVLSMWNRGQMVVTLDDRDLVTMLNMKVVGTPPEEVLRRKIMNVRSLIT